MVVAALLTAWVCVRSAVRRAARAWGKQRDRPGHAGQRPDCLLTVSRGCHVRHAVVNPRIPCTGSKRWSTRVTLPGARGPPRAPTSARTASSGPSATTSTRPSGRLVADPARPAAPASSRTNHRYPTPCTWPDTTATTRWVVTSAACSCSAGPRTGLALRAAVAGAVHERLPADRRPAPGAGPVALAVHRQEPREVAALSVDVDVQGVEGRAALREGLPQHVPHPLEQRGDLGAVQPIGRPGAVQLRPPQRLVGVDVADPADQRLVEQGALDLGPPPAQRGAEGGLVEGGVERVDRDVRQARRDAGPLVPALLDGQASEGPLVDEAQLAAAVGEPQTGAQVRLVGRGRLLDQQLPAHAQVRDERTPRRAAVGLGQRQPQVLAAPVRVGEGATGQRVDEVLDALEVPADGPRVVDLDDG